MDFQQGAPLMAEFKTMPVRRPIASVSRMVALGHTVVFRPEGQGGSFIKTKAGEANNIFARNGVFDVPNWVRVLSSGQVFPGARNAAAEW